MANDSKYLIISEVLVGGETANEEFVELHNPTSSDIDLESLPLKLHTINSTGSKDTNKSLVFNSKIIPAQGYFVISSKEFAEKFSDAVDCLYGSGVLAKGWSVYISTSKEKSTDVLDTIRWAECDKNHSYSFNGSDWECTSTPTPGKENEFDKIPEPKIYSDKIFLNELLPNPSGDESKDEFIELYNSSSNAEDLKDWVLRDGSKSGKYIFPKDSLINAGDYLTIYRIDFKFALNNSNESVYLENPDGKIISSVSYAGSAKEDLSYNFNSKNWRWSKFLTPGAENIFNNPPSTKTDVPKIAYRNMYADFSAKGSDKDKDKLKYVWDFGDGHKSYKQITRHKYERTGKYIVTLKVSDGSEDEIKTFKLEVKKYPEVDVKIVSLSPNPKGKDSDFEWIILRNNSKKKVNLKGWSIATGSKNLYNHPIAEDLFIKSGKELKITRAFSKFSLNNKSAKVELRYPNGKVASKVKYENKKSIAEDTLYIKTKNGWQWQVPEIVNTETTHEDAALEIESPVEEQVSQEEIVTNMGKYSPSDYWQDKQAQKIILLSYSSQIKTPSTLFAYSSRGRVLGASTENLPVRKHWAVKLLEDIWQKINIHLNELFLNFWP